jgi:hypothetical protein
LEVWSQYRAGGGLGFSWRWGYDRYCCRVEEGLQLFFVLVSPRFFYAWDFASQSPTRTS